MRTTARNVGLLGAGYIADWHAKALRRTPGVRLAAVCDQSAPRAEEVARRYGGTPYADLDAMLAGERLHAVHVLLPASLHFAATKRLLEAGIDAYVEKPLAPKADECDELAGLAHAKGVRLGVGHNFLFDGAYERLRADVTGGMIGPIEHVTIVWAKEFGPWRSGPFGSWVFREPANILLEVGPHSFAHALDLVGPPDRVETAVDEPARLPTGGTFYRRWLVRLFAGRACVELRFHFGPGFPEQSVTVRGPAGVAMADLERGTYTLRRRSGLPDDFDRYRRTVGEGHSLRRQARGNLARYILSKVKLSRRGNFFGDSIARAVAEFHAGTSDARLSADFAASVVRLCSRAGAAADLPRQEPGPRIAAPTKPADVLVLGGTGFIGRALVRQLVEAGRTVRLLARDPDALPTSLHGLPLDVRRGDIGRGIGAALEGVETVMHLARSQSRTWAEYETNEIGATRAVADACLAAGVRRLFYTGTTDSYFAGRKGEIITEATPLDPKVRRRNLYARAKAESEALLFAMWREKGLPVTVFRPAIVVGPGGDPCHWGIGLWGSPTSCLFWGDGDHPVPLVLADDVARALVLALERPGLVGESFNLAADPCVTPQEYVAELARATRTHIDTRPVSPWRFYAFDLFKWAVKVAVRHPERRFPSLRDWRSRTYHARFDCEKAKSVLGWRPTSDRETLLAEGVRRAAAEWWA